MKVLLRLLLCIGVIGLAVALAGCTPKNKPLAPIAAKLAVLRKLPSPRPEDEFPPAFFEARTALRDWMDTQLQQLGQDGEYQFAGKLNQQLKDAKLTCAQCDSATGGFADAIGYVGEIRLTKKGQLLQATTQLGVQCGFDESAYLYRWEDGKWRRVWDGAKEPGADGKYEPQRIDQVQFTNASARTDHQLILVLSEFPACNAKWRPVFTRLWSLPKGGDTATLLLDERGVAPLTQRTAPISARIAGDDDLLVCHRVASIDPDVGSRVRAGHYRLTQGKMQRVVPYALTPRDFVEEWVTDPWPESVAMTADEAQSALEEQHKQLHRDHIVANFVSATSHCGTSGDQYQIHMMFHPNPAKDGEDRYFRVHWVPPYMFELTGVSDQPDKACGEPDPRNDYRMSIPGLRC